MSILFPYDRLAVRLDGSAVPLTKYRGRVLLIVNTASRCGFTRQYAGLQGLHDLLHAEGLSVLGFPCNQFGGQEPGDAKEIADFSERNFSVTFDVFEKVDVIGPNRHPVFEWLHHASDATDDVIPWNFTKFLITRDGKLARRFAPNAAPESIESQIRELLSEESLHDRTG